MRVWFIRGIRNIRFDCRPAVDLLVWNFVRIGSSILTQSSIVDGA